MAYPLFPLVPNFDNTFTVEANINKSQYGTGGVMKQEPKGINVLSTKWAFNVTTTKVSLAQTFLNTNLGKPIRLPFDSLGTTDGNLYRIIDYKISYVDSVTQNFSCEFKQVRRLKVI